MVPEQTFKSYLDILEWFLHFISLLAELVPFRTSPFP